MTLRRKTRTITVESRSLGPTPERIAKADEHFVIGNDQQGGKVYTFQDDVLERARKRQVIDARGYALRLIVVGRTRPGRTRRACGVATAVYTSRS